MPICPGALQPVGALRMLGLVLAALVMTSSDDWEMSRAIAEAQARARVARAHPAAASVLQAEPADAPVEHAAMFDPLPAGALAGGMAGASRRTCKKDKLAIACGNCSNPKSKNACAYKTGAWDPPGVTNAPAEPIAGSTADTSTGSTAQDQDQKRSRQPTDFLDPGEFRRRDLPEVAERRGESSSDVAGELAELEGALVSRLKEAEQELAVFKHREQREAQAKRQKTMESFFDRSRGLPTRPAHFNADISNASGYSETELRRTFRADVAAVEERDTCLLGGRENDSPLVTRVIVDSGVILRPTYIANR